MQYRKLNIFFACIGLAFVAGILWQWRGALRGVGAPIEDRSVDEVPVVSVRDEKIERSEDQKIEGEDQEVHESDLPIFRSSDLPTSSTLPSRINLAVPFTSQAPEKDWSQPWQDACEEAAVLMLDAYYKGYGLSPLFAKDELLKMIAWEENEKQWGWSITIEQVKGLAEWYMGTKLETRNSPSSRTQAEGKLETNSNNEILNSNLDIVSNFDIRISNFHIIENPTVEQIKQSIASGHPVLVMAYGKALPNPYFRNLGPEYHALVILAYTDTQFITNDPGTWRGENLDRKSTL